MLRACLLACSFVTLAAVPALAQPADKKQKAEPAAKPMTQEEKDAAAAAGAGVLGMGLFCTIFAGVLALVVYFAPTIIGLIRKHPNMAPILAVNFFLGWSLIGWVVALAWALTAQEGRPRYGRRSSRDDYDD
jgi:hypothetical protein